MKVKAPFKISFGGPQKFELWGYGLGYPPMNILSFGYNVRGMLWSMPTGTWWDFVNGWKQKSAGQRTIEVRSVVVPHAS